MVERNLFALTFFGDGDCGEEEYAAFHRLIGLTWPGGATAAQADTVIDTAQNFPDCTIKVYRRPGRDVLLVEAEDTKDDILCFYAKIEPNGSYS